MGKLRVAYINGNEVGIEYVAADDVDVNNANVVNGNKADNLEVPLSILPISISNIMLVYPMKRGPSRCLTSL